MATAANALDQIVVGATELGTVDYARVRRVRVQVALFLQILESLGACVVCTDLCA